MPRIDLAAFRKGLEGVVANAVGEAEEDIRVFAKAIFETVVGTSPVITAYYKSNHRILVRNAGGQFVKGGAGGASLVPRDKPVDAAPGQYEGNVNNILSSEPAKLDAFRLGGRIEIFTDVFYAGGPDGVEERHGVYSGAAATFGLDVEDA